MLPIIITSLVTLVLYFLMRLFIRQRKPGEPPLVPYNIPYLGSALEFNKNTHKFLSDCQKEHGDIFTVYLAGKYYTFILNPRNYANYFKQSTEVFSFRKVSVKTYVNVFGGDLKVFTAVEPYRKTHTRPALRQGLQGDGLEHLSNTMQINLHKMFKSLTLVGNDWQKTGLYDFCYLTIFTAGFISLLGEAEEDLANMATIIKNFREFDRSFIQLLSGCPKVMLKKALKARGYLHDLFKKERRVKRRNISEIMKLRQTATDSLGKDIFPESAEPANTLSFLWASQGNTIPAVFWALFYMTKHPEATEAVLAEMREKLGPIEEAKDNVTYTREQLDQLEILGEDE